MFSNPDESISDGNGAGYVNRGSAVRTRTLLLLSTFCIGLLAVWLVPAVEGNAENREPARMPPLSAGALLHDTTYQQIDRAIRDKIGARSVASRAVGAVSVGLLGTSPSSAVFLGEGKLAFVGEDFTAPCNNSDSSFATVGKGLAEWDLRFEAADKYLMYVVPPDKSSIRTEQLGPLGDSLMVCSEISRANIERWATMAGSPVLSLWDEVSKQDQEPEGAYLSSDTHWNWQGASVMTKAILNRLVEDGEAPSAVLPDLETLVFGSDQVFTGDLHRLMGLADTEEVSTVKYDRPGVTTTKETGTSASGAPETRWTSVSETAALVPGRTLIYGDSFLGYTESQLPGFFEDVTFMRTDSFLTPGQLASMGNYDRVVVERVQRFAAYEKHGLLFDLSVGLN